MFSTEMSNPAYNPSNLINGRGSLLSVEPTTKYTIVPGGDTTRWPPLVRSSVRPSQPGKHTEQKHYMHKGLIIGARVILRVLGDHGKVPREVMVDGQPLSCSQSFI
jgi:hypothetical protein